MSGRDVRFIAKSKVFPHEVYNKMHLPEIQLIQTREQLIQTRISCIRGTYTAVS